MCETFPESSKLDSPEVPSVATPKASRGPDENASVGEKYGVFGVVSSKVIRGLDDVTEAKLRRAERFGIPPGESEKAALRAARFGTVTKDNRVQKAMISLHCRVCSFLFIFINFAFYCTTFSSSPP